MTTLKSPEDLIIKKFCKAIDRANIKDVKAMLSKQPELANAIDQKRTSLMRAIEAGSDMEVGSAEDLDLLKIIKLLIPLCDPKEKDQKGRDALMHAADAGYLEALLLLLPHCDPLAKDHAGWSALMHAVPSSREGVPNCIPPLLASSRVMEAGGDGQTALHFAANVGNLKSIELLLPACTGRGGFEPNDPRAFSAFMNAVHNKNAECADAIGSSFTIERACEFLRWAPKDVELPRMRAMLERLELQQAIHGSKERVSEALGVEKTTIVDPIGDSASGIETQSKKQDKKDKKGRGFRL